VRAWIYIPVSELEDSDPFVMYLSWSSGVSLKKKKKNPRSESFLCSSSSSHFQRSIFSHFMEEDAVGVPMTPQPSAGEDHQQVSRAPCPNFSVVGEFSLRTSL
jgi:hypothetical protein